MQILAHNKIMTGWYNPVFLEYEAHVVSWTMGEIYSWKRPFEHVSHAEGLLQNGENEFFRIDIITTLKRAIDHRLKLLNKLYCWKKIPYKLPNDELQKLETLGVVKKNMLLNLYKIRNEVEHQDKSIPTLAKCIELTEVTWYFLKSTNHLVINVPSELWFTDESESELSKVEIEPQKNWRINISTKEKSKNFSFPPIEGWIKVSITGKENMGKESFMIFSPELPDFLALKLLNTYFFIQS